MPRAVRNSPFCHAAQKWATPDDRQGVLGRDRLLGERHRQGRPRRPSMLAPVLPRRHRMRVRPQAAAFLSGFALSVGEFARLSYRT
jgi:hypothetical protein